MISPRWVEQCCSATGSLCRNLLCLTLSSLSARPQLAAKSVAFMVVLDGVDYAFDDTPESLLYLCAALQPLLPRMTPGMCLTALNKLNGKAGRWVEGWVAASFSVSLSVSLCVSDSPSVCSEDDDAKDWEAVGVFRAALEEKSKSATVAHAKPAMAPAPPTPPSRQVTAAATHGADDAQDDAQDGGGGSDAEQTPADEVEEEDEPAPKRGRASVAMMDEASVDAEADSDGEVDVVKPSPRGRRKRASPAKAAKPPPPARQSKRRKS